MLQRYNKKSTYANAYEEKFIFPQGERHFFYKRSDIIACIKATGRNRELAHG